jgi:hypothetical protein
MFRTHYADQINSAVTENVPSTFLLEENTMTTAWYVALPRFALSTGPFKEKIDQMLSSGLIQQWYSELWFIPKYKKRYVEKLQPRVLTVDDLRLGFLAFFICATISLVVFLMEMGLSRFRF